MFNINIETILKSDKLLKKVEDIEKNQFKVRKKEEKEKIMKNNNIDEKNNNINNNDEKNSYSNNKKGIKMIK